jgi:hypothetical protein
MTVFESLKAKVGKFSLANKKLLVPEMGRTVSHLIGATMRSFGVDAQVMETYKGLKLGKQYTSGKECFPCQVTLGDVLYHLESLFHGGIRRPMPIRHVQQVAPHRHGFDGRL